MVCSSLFGSPAGSDDKIRLYGMVAMPESEVSYSGCRRGRPLLSIDTRLYPGELVQREIAEQWGVRRGPSLVETLQVSFILSLPARRLAARSDDELSRE